MWKRAMRAMDVGVEAAASPQCMVPLQARLELVNAIGQLNVGSFLAPSSLTFVHNMLYSVLNFVSVSDFPVLV